MNCGIAIIIFREDINHKMFCQGSHNLDISIVSNKVNNLSADVWVYDSRSWNFLALIEQESKIRLEVAILTLFIEIFNIFLFDWRFEIQPLDQILSRRIL